MSHELQQGKGRKPSTGATGRSDANLARRGNGEPGDSNSFWLGGYNEVLISRSFYQSGMPWSVAATFFVAGGDKDGSACAKHAQTTLREKFGANASHVLLLKHTPGADPAFEEWDHAAAEV